MSYEPSPRGVDLRQRVTEFLDSAVIPAEAVYEEQMEASGDPHSHPQVIEDLKATAKERGLWNLFLPHKTPWTPDPVGNLDYAYLAELAGRSHLASEAMNCSAPDVASSDATNIQLSIRRDGDEYVLNGRKWWISGAASERCAIFIVMGKTDPKASRHQQQSMILVPRGTPGLTIVRNLPVFGYTDREGHSELRFEDVRVPATNLIAEEGTGFAIAQARLGPGRIHHCMRCIGMAERALELMCRRVLGREAFGKPLAAQGVIREWIADSRIEIEQARLLTLKAAYLMDTVGHKGASTEISAIKVVAPNMALRVVDRAIQAHGGGGVSDDFPLARMYAGLRTLRFADGPDEVHRRQLARAELGKYAS